MGGTVSLVSSVLGLMSNMQKPDGATDNSAQLAAERKAKEDAQTQKEADERRRERGKVTEARQLEKKRLSASGRQTTLANGGAGLLNDPEVTNTVLKSKLGE